MTRHYEMNLTHLRGLDATGLVVMDGATDERRLVAWHGHIEPGGALPPKDLWLSVDSPSTRDRILRWMAVRVGLLDTFHCPRWQRNTLHTDTWALCSDGEEVSFSTTRANYVVPNLRGESDPLHALIAAALWLGLDEHSTQP